jgi:hypothetical protein
MEFVKTNSVPLPDGDFQRGFLDSLASDIAETDSWGLRFQQLRRIEKLHAEADDAEQPRISTKIISGAGRLIRQLADQQKWPPPTCMTGTVDATICFEWHDPAGEERFVSIDVTDSDQAEKFTQYRDGRPSQLERFTF